MALTDTAGGQPELTAEQAKVLQVVIEECITERVIAESERGKAIELLEKEGPFDRQMAKDRLKRAVKEGKLQPPEPEVTEGDASPRIKIKIGEKNLSCVLDDSDETLKHLRTKLEKNGKMRSVDTFVVDGVEVLKSQEEEHEISGGIEISKQEYEPPSATLPGLDLVELAKMFPDDDPEARAKKIAELIALRDGVLKGRATNNLIDNAVKAATSENIDKRAPHRLSENAWHELMQINTLMNALDMNREIPQRAIRPAFRPRRLTPCFRPYSRAEISASVTSEERFHQRTKSKIHKSEASLSYGFVSIKQETTHRKATQDTRQSSRLFLVGQWNLPRVKLFFDEREVEPDPDFVVAIDAALENVDEALEKVDEAPEKIDEAGDLQAILDCYERLRRVSEEYGQVWPVEVTLGGQLEITDTRDNDENSTREETELAVRAAVSAKLAEGAASAGHGYSGKTQDTSKIAEGMQALNFTATGGEPLLANRKDDLSEWIASVAPYPNWRVISLERIQPLHEFIGRFEALEQQSKKIALVLHFVESQPETLNYGDIVYLKSAWKPLNWLCLQDKRETRVWAHTRDRGAEESHPYRWRIVQRPDQTGEGPVKYGSKVFLEAESNLWLRGRLQFQSNNVYKYVGTGPIGEDGEQYYAWKIRSANGSDSEEENPVEIGDEVKFELEGGYFLVGGNRSARCYKKEQIGSYTNEQIEDHSESDSAKWIIQSLTTPPR